MRRAWVFIPMIGLLISVSLYARPAVAQEGDAALGEANIRVTPGQNGVDVVEKITLTNVQALGGEVEHVASRPEESQPRDVRVTSGGRELRVDHTDGESLERFVVVLPEGASGDFDYQVTYSYPGNEDSMRVPMIVPAIPTDAVTANVSMELVTPEGEYVQSSFPLFDSAENGTMSADMVSFPSYASFTLDSSPAGILTRPNLYTGLAIALIAACCIALMLYERNARTKQGTREVTDV